MKIWYCIKSGATLVLRRANESLSPETELQSYSVIGNTPDFGSVFLGSSPSRTTTPFSEEAPILSGLF